MNKSAFSRQRSAISQRVASRFLTLVVCVVSLSAQGDQADPVSREVLLAAIDRLGAFEYEARMEAGRTLRRAPGALAVPALADAVAEHADSYVRFRALVLLSGFNDPRGNEVILQQVSDRNDRLRAVTYSYFVHNPDEAEVAELVAALSRETSAFVRPALIRALAAQGDEPTVRKTLLAELDRGENFFRSTVIEALGDYRARYASASLILIAQEDGPLQVPAVLALGQIGDQQALETLAELQRRVPLSSQPTVAAAVCLLGVDCTTHLGYLTVTVRFATDQSGYQSLLRSAAFGLGALAAPGNADALETLFDVGIPSSRACTRADRARDRHIGATQTGVPALCPGASAGPRIGSPVASRRVRHARRGLRGRALLHDRPPYLLGNRRGFPHAYGDRGGHSELGILVA